MGVLRKYYEKNYRQGSCLEVPALNKLIVLGACALTLGCVLPEPMLPKIEGLVCPIYQAFILTKHPDAYRATPLARKQLFEAIDDYQPGRTHSYGNKSMFELMATGGISIPGATVTLKNVGPTKVIDVMAEGKTLMTSYVGVPTDDELALPACYSYHVCGGCGASSPTLQACSGCKSRKYCSKKCQKKNWSMHKTICRALSTDEMEQYLKSISDIKLESSTSSVKGMKTNLPIGPDHPLNKKAP